MSVRTVLSSSSLTLLATKTPSQPIPIILGVSKSGSRSDDRALLRMEGATTPAVECAEAAEAPKAVGAVRAVVGSLKTGGVALLRVDEVGIWHREAEASPNLRMYQTPRWPTHRGFR